MEKEEGRGGRERGFYMCAWTWDRSGESLGCWGLVSVGGKGELFPGASFH